MSLWSLNQLNLIESGMNTLGKRWIEKTGIEGAKNQDIGTFKWVDHELCTKVLDNLTLTVLVGTSQESCVTRLAMVPSHMFNMRILTGCLHCIQGQTKSQKEKKKRSILLNKGALYIWGKSL